MTLVALATEDALSEAIGQRLLLELPVAVTPSPLLRKDGFGYLRSGMPKWRNLAKLQAVLIITDLDRLNCPLKLIDDWLGSQPAPENLLLRVAVREVESWVLADHDALRKLLGSKGKLPVAPDTLPDPKSHLLTLAKSASRSVREDLVQQNGSVASQGIAYNNRLTAWVHAEWSPERASQRSPSLQRARMRLRELLVSPRQT